MNETFLQLLMSRYFDAWLKAVHHRMDREHAKQFIRLLVQYHNAGILATCLSEISRPE